MALQGVINPDASRIWDNAETWIALRDDVVDIAAMIPTNVDDDLAALGWEFIGLQDAEKGVPFTPEGDDITDQITAEPGLNLRERECYGGPRHLSSAAFHHRPMP